MSSEFDDNLRENKRKNTNPAQTTNLLIVAGFIALAVLIIFLMQDKSNPMSNLDVDGTVNARLNEFSVTQATTESEKAIPTVAPARPTFPPPTAPPIEERPIVEGTQINAGESAIGTIKDKTFEIQYTFDALANVPYVITLQGIDLETPEVILVDSNGNRIISSVTANQAIGTTINRVIGAVFPDAGQYTIAVTREGGRVGEDEGEFKLSLDIPASLYLQSDTTGSTSSDAWTWYSYQSDSPFYIRYNHKSGNYQPDVGIYKINEKSEFVTQGYMVGSVASHSEVGQFEANVMYFIAVGQSTLKKPEKTPIETSSYSLGVQIAR